jgi:hypothetical protein
MSIERRFTNCLPTRIETRADGTRVIVGYAAVFYDPADPGTEYRLWSDYVERVASTAFDRAIREKDDCRGLFNHDPSMLLGRCAAGTMRLSVDAKGLRYEIDLPDTQVGRDVAVSVERGDLTGSSFSFACKRTSFVETPDQTVRILEDVELYDCGPVTYPAYESTTTGLRAAGDAQEALKARDAWQKENQSAAAEIRAKLAGLRLRELDDRMPESEQKGFAVLHVASFSK